MKYIDEPMKLYFEKAASGSETPGGGSIAGACGALAASMKSMVCSFTAGKKKYADVADEAETMLNEAKQQVQTMLELMVADTEGFEAVSAAYGLPKRTEEEKQMRMRAIQDGCRTALEVPEKIFDCSLDILRSLKRLVEFGNRNLISDVGVSAVTARAAAESAAMNVSINLKFIKDKAFAAEKRKKIDAGLAEADSIEAEVKKMVWAAVS